METRFHALSHKGCRAIRTTSDSHGNLRSRMIWAFGFGFGALQGIGLRVRAWDCFSLYYSSFPLKKSPIMVCLWRLLEVRATSKHRKKIDQCSGISSWVAPEVKAYRVE